MYREGEAKPDASGPRNLYQNLPMDGHITVEQNMSVNIMYHIVSIKSDHSILCCGFVFVQIGIMTCTMS